MKHVLRHHINKMIDHRWWEARPLHTRHVVYAATDTDAHLQLAQAAGAVEALAGPVDDDPESAVEEFEEELGVLGEHPALPTSSEACTRHRNSASEPDDATSQLVPVDETEDDDDDEAQAEDDLDVTIDRAIESDDRSRLLSLLKKQIDAFFTSNTVARELQMPSCLKKEERKVLHDHCDRNWPAKRKQSVGPPGDRRIVLSNAWSPPANLTAAVAYDAIGDMVARRWQLQASNPRLTILSVATSARLALRREHRGGNACTPMGCECNSELTS